MSARYLPRRSRFYAEFAGSAAGMQDLLDVIEDDTGYDPDDCAVMWLRSALSPDRAPCP